LQGSNYVNTFGSSFAKIFYLALASLTLLAAAAQWLPEEGFPPEIHLGPNEARGQSPLSAATGGGNLSAPGAATTAPYPTTPYANTAPYPTTSQYPTTKYPSATPAFGSPPAAVAAPTVTPTVYAPPVAAPPMSVAAPAPVAGSAPVAAPPSSAEPAAQELEATRVVARIGGEVILAGEVIASVNGFLARNGVDPHDPKLRAQKQEYVKMRLKQLVETRVVVNEARRKIPEEGYKRAMEKFDEEFMNNIAPKMARERKLPDVAALEAQLRADGTTLEREKRNFAEQVLANSWVSQNVQVSQDVPHPELLKYYQEHGADYDFPAEVRWEQISVRFDTRSKAEAYAMLAQAGNQVVDGRPFAEVAKAVSQGLTAAQGGAQPWTKRGSLASNVLDEALFALPVGALSPILEDERGFHIVRVVERREAGRVPFTEAQVEIRKKINAGREEAAKKEMVAKIREQTNVWTIYDEAPVVGSAPGSPGYR
jgi:hypothetical protein